MVGIIDSVDMSLRKLWGIVKESEAWRAAVHGVTKSQTRLRGRTATTSVNTYNNLCEAGAVVPILQKRKQAQKLLDVKAELKTLGFGFHVLSSSPIPHAPTI